MIARIITALYHTEEETIGAETFYQEAFSENLPDSLHPLVQNGWAASEAIRCHLTMVNNRNERHLF